MEPGMEPHDEGADWEVDEGIPQFEDPFIQQYLRGRRALIDEEKKQKHDTHFRQTMTPAVEEACRIVSRIRSKELKEVWSKYTEESLENESDATADPRTEFDLIRDRMEKTDLWKIIRKMPKGALLHGHLETMFDLDVFAEQVLTLNGLHITAHTPLATSTERENTPITVRYLDGNPKNVGHGASIWDPKYEPMTPVPVQDAAEAFPTNAVEGFLEWFKTRYASGPRTSQNCHRKFNDVWNRLLCTENDVNGVRYYEPVFRACLRRLLGELHEDGIQYAEFRLVFDFEYQRGQGYENEVDYFRVFHLFGEEIELYKASDRGSNFHGARMIWTALRSWSNREIIDSMKQCIDIKHDFPELISGFDLIGREKHGRPLADLVPLLFWFKKQCAVEGLDIPFLFHVGECLGDGDKVDGNLYDAILLGSRRMGQAWNVYKHPLLMDMVKQKKILVDGCPVSKDPLQGTNSNMPHPLPALLSRGIPVSLCNDADIRGYGKNGLTHDFCRVLNSVENIGLSGLAAMVENSIRWSCFEDQSPEEWLNGINQGITGTGTKAEQLRAWYTEFERFCQWVVLEFGSVEDENTS